MADGTVTIQTKLDTTELKSDIKKATKELNLLEKEEQKLTEQKITVTIDVDNTKKQIDEISARYEKMISNAKGWEVDVYLDRQDFELSGVNSNYETQKKLLTDINSQISDNKSKQNELTSAIASSNIKIQTSKLLEEQAKQEATEYEEQVKQIEQAQDDLNNTINSTISGVNNTIKKVTKLTLAVFGIRTAYNFVKSSASTLANYNDQLADDIEYITYSVASALEGVITKIVNLIYTALQYVNYLSIAWFGVNLFANATTDSLNSSNEAADELNETLAGFDDLQVLSDDGSSSSSSDTVSPSVDLSSMEDVEIPDWLVELGDNLDKVIDALEILVGIKLASWLLEILPSLSILVLLFKDLKLSLIEIVAVFLAAYLIVSTFMELWEDPTWENLQNFLGAVIIALGILAVAFSSVTLGVAALAVVVVALGAELVKWLIDNWENIKDAFSDAIDWIADKFSDLKTWFSEKISALGDIFSNLWDGFKNGASDAWEGIKNIFSTVADFFKNIFSTAWEGVKSVFSKGGEIFSGITDGILSSFKSIVNTLIDGINTVVAIPFNGINTALSKIKNIEILGVEPFKNVISTISIPEIPKLATGGIIDVPGRGVTATVGEAGKEAVLPLENNTEWMDTLADKISNKSNTEITLYVYYEDGKKIIKKINKANSLAGKQLLEI